jgi:lipoprotein NlpI
MVPLRTLMLSGALALGPAAVLAQSPSDAERCRTIAGNPDLAIQLCTRAIESGKLPAREVAQVYFSRGVELTAKGEFDRAIADFDAALKADAKLSQAYYNRGIAWANKGEPDRAIADFDAVLRADAKHADALHSRGTEWMVKGDYQRALADFDATLRANPKAQDVYFPRGRALFYSGEYARATAEIAKAHQAQPSDYTALWLYLARKHGGAAEPEALIERDTRATRDGGWPSGVIALYAGEAEPDPVMKSAEDRDPKKQTEQRCEANFYLAHWHLLQKANERALLLLDEAQRSCPRNVIEYEGTLAALRQLKAR